MKMMFQLALVALVVGVAISLFAGSGQMAAEKFVGYGVWVLVFGVGYLISTFFKKK